jgi:uncharacterized lipoprotein YmbA
MSSNLSPRIRALAIALGALLSACRSAPTRLYTLYPVASNSVRETYTGPPVRVDAVHFPPALDRIEIVRDVAPGEMAVNDLEHWSAPLGQTARQALAADLVSRLPPGKSIFPHLAKPDGALGLNVDVLEFKTDAGGFSLQVSWVVHRAGQASATGGGTATLRTTVSGDGSAATVQALSILLGELANRIVTSL